MRKVLFMAVCLAAAAFVGCKNGSEDGMPKEGKTNSDLMLAGDKTVKGLACEGCTDSVIWLYPGDGKDPVKYEIIDAWRHRKVIGRIKVGDWIGLVVNEEDSTVADFVINLDQLKGSWCYIVMPKLRDYDQLSKKQQARMERDMPDSIKERYLVPREYGFTLKRQFVAQTIGMVRGGSSLDDSPVVYPPLTRYNHWNILNGRLVLTYDESESSAWRSKVEKGEAVGKPRIVSDTVDVLFMNEDSLVLRYPDHTQSYYRLSAAADANKLAREKAEKIAKEALRSVTDGSDGH